MSNRSNERRRVARRLPRAALILVVALAILASCGKPKNQVVQLTPAPDQCTVTQAAKVTTGGDQSLSASKDMLAFDQRDSHGIFQLWTMRPNGTDQTCLTCQARQGEPPVDRHKFNPTWQPGGNWLVVQVELSKHPLGAINSQDLFSELLLNGVWNDLYAVSADGSRWVKLTDTSDSKTDGNYSVGFSPDGKEVMWTQIVEAAGSGHPWGVWRLKLADFDLSSGTPKLSNVRDVTPEGTRFIENPTFSPDGSSILVSSDHDSTSRWQMDIWKIDLSTGQASNITGHDGAWNEHATFTPDGRHIIFMSTRMYPNTSFQADLVMTNLDGSDWRQLTRFNIKGAVEYAGHKVMPIQTRWSPDGTQLTETLQSGDHYPDRELWTVTFAGACGGAPSGAGGSSA